MGQDNLCGLHLNSQAPCASATTQLTLCFLCLTSKGT